MYTKSAISELPKTSVSELGGGGNVASPGRPAPAGVGAVVGAVVGAGCGGDGATDDFRGTRRLASDSAAAGGGRSSGWSGRATAACVCTAAEVSSACMCVWLERRTSAAQSETASSALRVALQPCAVLRGGSIEN